MHGKRPDSNFVSVHMQTLRLLSKLRITSLKINFIETTHVKLFRVFFVRTKRFIFCRYSTVVELKKKQAEYYNSSEATSAGRGVAKAVAGGGGICATINLDPITLNSIIASASVSTNAAA